MFLGDNLVLTFNWAEKLEHCFTWLLKTVTNLAFRTSFGSGGMKASPSSVRSHWGTVKMFTRRFWSSGFTPGLCIFAASLAQSKLRMQWGWQNGIWNVLLQTHPLQARSHDLCLKLLRNAWCESDRSHPTQIYAPRFPIESTLKSKFAALPKVVRASREPMPPLQGGSFPAKRSSTRSGIVETQSQSTFKVRNKSSFPKTGSSVERENLSKFRSTPSISQGKKHWCTWKRSAMPKALCTVFQAGFLGSRPCGISLWPSWKRCGMNIGRPVQLYSTSSYKEWSSHVQGQNHSRFVRLDLKEVTSVPSSVVLK